MATNSMKKRAKKWDSLKPPTAEPLPAKKIKNKTGKDITQYPPVVGHHGTDEEKDLSPEE